MPKITFIGAGSSIFVKNVLGDCMCTPALAESRLALFDIDEKRLRQSETMLRCLNQNLGNHASVEVYHDRKEALRDADYVINAIAVGEYDPYIVSDFQIKIWPVSDCRRHAGNGRPVPRPAHHSCHAGYRP